MPIVFWVICGVYGLLLFVVLTNMLFMLKPRSQPLRAASLVILIPARNEAANLALLLPNLIRQGARVIVCDDHSDDDTAVVAASAGATVIRAAALPDGWTGKNHACHQLFLAASESVEADWYVFLDADVEPKHDFVPRISDTLAEFGSRWPVITGFPQQLPGMGLESMYLGWVWWILLATNPFGLVCRTGQGHNHFLNGQIICWRARTYAELLPHQAMRGAVLEDVMIGRWLAKLRIRVLVMNLSDVLGVRMYPDLRSAFDGMSKNAFQVAGSPFGTVLLGTLLAAIALAWVPFVWSPLVALPLGLLTISRLFTQMAVKSGGFWLLHPVSLLMASATFFRSEYLRRKGRISWKGRVYADR